MRPLHIAGVLLISVLWGGNFVASKIGMEHFPPFLFTALRFATAGLLLFPFIARPTRAQIPQLLQLSLMLGVLHFSLIIGGLYYGLDIASTALGAQMGVPFACLLSVLLLGDKLGGWRLMGMLIAFGGIVLLTGAPQVNDNWLGFSLVLLGAFCWGVSNIIMKRMDDMPGLMVLGWMAIFALPQLVLVSWIIEGDQWKPFMEAPVSAWLAGLYTGINSTIIAYGLWYYLLKRYAINQVAPYSLLVPVFSVGFGQLFFDEPLSWQTLAGGATVITGVAIIVMRRPKLVTIGDPV